ncbi:MAG: membrane protein insertion efficiency factor YidD [Cardiobacteriaceae bacterium]|nr:membrane protein insertion efficiency factor YidD [Cardiobacteriaceae bacterium]
MKLKTALNLAFSRLFIGLIKLYRLILSPYMGQQCRFYPSCSHYGEEAIREHGALYGSWLTLKRIARCNPCCEGGFDPVPPRPQSPPSPDDPKALCAHHQP